MLSLKYVRTTRQTRVSIPVLRPRNLLAKGGGVFFFFGSLMVERWARLCALSRPNQETSHLEETRQEQYVYLLHPPFQYFFFLPTEISMLLSPSPEMVPKQGQTAWSPAANKIGIRTTLNSSLRLPNLRSNSVRRKCTHTQKKNFPWTLVSTRTTTRTTATGILWPVGFVAGERRRAQEMGSRKKKKKKKLSPTSKHCLYTDTRSAREVCGSRVVFGPQR